MQNDMQHFHAFAFNKFPVLRLLVAPLFSLNFGLLTFCLIKKITVVSQMQCQRNLTVGKLHISDYDKSKQIEFARSPIRDASLEVIF